MVVAIGRNVGNRPMAIAAWRRYQRETGDVLGELGTVMSRTVGRYGGSEAWPAEDTALYVVDGVVGSGAIQVALTGLLARYGQEAAGVIVGELEEVRAWGQ